MASKSLSTVFDTNDISNHINIFISMFFVHRNKMIDKNLIAVCSHHATVNLEKTIFDIPKVLGRIDDLLCVAARSKLNRFLAATDDSAWQLESGQEELHRKKINWDPESVIEEIHEIMFSLTPVMNKMFPTIKTRHFWGISIWKDMPGYYIKEHTDNPDLDCVIQLYLDSHGFCPGTIFHHNGHEIEIPHCANSGYIYHNGKQKLMHNISQVVPVNTTRYSLYVQWSLLPKYGADAP